MKKCPFLTIVLLMVIWELVKYFGFRQVAATSTSFFVATPPKLGAPSKPAAPPKLSAPPKTVEKYNVIPPNEKNAPVQEFKAVLKAASDKDVHVTSTQGSGGNRKTQVNLTPPAKLQPQKSMSKIG